MTTTMSQKAAREGLGSPDLFEGGVYVTKMVLLSCLCKRRLREAEIRERNLERQSNALLKLTMMAKQEIKIIAVCRPKKRCRRLRDARK